MIFLLRTSLIKARFFMKSNQSKNYEEWLEKAHEDELTARK